MAGQTRRCNDISVTAVRAEADIAAFEEHALKQRASRPAPTWSGY
jgi:hypothetical protein